MRKTSREDGRRTVLLRPGRPLDDAEDSTICTETTANRSRPEQRVRDKILQEPRHIKAEDGPRAQPVPVLPEDPWTERTADAFWDQLQDEMLHKAMETESVEVEAEKRPKPRRQDFLDHEDRRQEPKTREKWRTEMDKHRQAARDLNWRQSLEAEPGGRETIMEFNHQANTA